MEASALAAARWGLDVETAATTAGAAVDTLNASIQKTTTAMEAMQTIQFQGNATPAQFAGMTTAQLQSAGLLDMYDQVTMAGQAAIEQAWWRRGYSIGGTLTPAAQQAAFASGTTVNSTVNVTSPLGTSSQIAAAVSSALADALRRQGATIPTS